MYPRGRSRDVSPVAIARQASEERRRNRTSTSDSEKHSFGQFYLSPSSPSSSSSGTSPPSLTPPDPAPLSTYPRTRVVCQDTSYAPIDPRESPFSAQIFNPQHLPYSVESRLSSPLPSYPPKKATPQIDAGQRARDQARVKCRYETLARAEQGFATILERSRRERIAAFILRARQEDAKERERVTRELERQEQERDSRRPVTHISHVRRSGFRVLARVPPPVPTSQQRQVPDRFTYTIPFLSTSPTNPAPIRQQSGSMKTRLGLSALTSSNAVNTRSVSFDDVRTSMGNALFPIDHGESASGKTRRESELLEILLEPVRWEDGERWLPGSRVNAWAVPMPEALTGCEACASASLFLDGISTTFPQTPSSSSGISASTSTSVASRPISWLSFGSRKSTPSITTAQPTPASGLNCASSRPTPQRSCGCTRGQSFVAVDVNDSPLGSSVKPLSAMAFSAASVNTHQEPVRHRPRKISLSARTWLAMHSSVASVLSAAARFQVAYVSSTAAMLTETDYTQDPPTLMRSSPETVSGYARRLPTGWRASRSDVAKYTSTASHTDKDAFPYLIFHLVELTSNYRFPPPMPEQLNNLPAYDSIPPQSPTSSSIAIPPTYQDADRHIFNANPLHLLSRAQINSWRFRGAPGVMPTQVICRPELFYRIEPAGGSLRSARGGSALKWGCRVVWDADDHRELS